jgi:hypothetical protein
MMKTGKDIFSHSRSKKDQYCPFFKKTTALWALPHTPSELFLKKEPRPPQKL